MEEHDADQNNSHNPAVHSDNTTRPDRPEARHSRRSHKKSRNGCQHCKRRRIKCDEAKPTCGNCLRLSIPCNFTPPGSQPEAIDLGPEVVRKRGRPRKNWTVVSVGSDRAQRHPCEPTTVSTPSSSTSSDQHLERPLHLPWDAQDLELFFHYLNEVCNGLGMGDSQLWKDRAPRLGFRRHGVLHLLLAVSALHLARQDPNRRYELEERAEMHLAVGLRSSTEILPRLSAENCAELYVSTILVCICSFAKRPGPGHLLLVADGSEVAWWELFKGVRIIIETIGIATIFAGELGPLPSDVTGDHQGEDPNQHDHINWNVVEWEGALGHLSALISSVPSQTDRDACQSALGMMTWCFQETYGSTARPKPRVDAKFNTIMAWPYCLSDEFIGNLKNKEPVSLILLAHFAVLLQTLDAAWFMEGWAAHILGGVSSALELELHEWLRWPTLQLERAGALVTPSVVSNEMNSSLVTIRT